MRTNEPIELEGYVDVPADDLYQFRLRSPRQVQITVDETTICHSPDERWKFVPVALQTGMHRLRVTVSGDGPPQMTLRFGGPGASSIGVCQLRPPRKKTGESITVALSPFSSAKGDAFPVSRRAF